MEKELENFIKEKIKKQDKAFKSIYRLVLGTIIDLKIPQEIVLDYIECSRKDKVFSSLDFLEGGNWVSNVNNKNHVKLMKGLFECRPIGLGTPNAASGEGELMLLLSSVQITKPKKNDIQINNCNKNLKNENPRIFADIRGVDLNKIMMKECEDLNLIPNKDKQGKLSVQLFNKSFIDKHWNPQFKNITEGQLNLFIKTFLVSLFPNKKIENDEITNLINCCIVENQLISDKWIDELIIFIYKYCNDKFENLLTINVDGDVKVIPSDYKDFEDKVRLGVIKFDKDYFRMHQDIKVGVYIKF